MTDEQREAEKRLERVRAELVESERLRLGGGRAMRILVVFLALNTLLSTGWTCVVTGIRSRLHRGDARTTSVSTG